MRILLDKCTPRGIAAVLQGHHVVERRSRGWDRLRNSDLLDAAEAASFEVLITADQSMQQEQNLAGRKIAIVALGSNSWRVIRPRLKGVAAAVEKAPTGTITVISLTDE